MDPVGAPVPLHPDHSPAHQQRQSILGSFLRVRPRGSSQSHQAPPPLDQPQQPQHQAAQHDGAQLQQPAQDFNHDMPNQPPSPGPGAMAGHRRRPAAGQLQPSQSHAFNSPNINPSAVHSLSSMLRRRRSANGALNTTPNVVPAPASATASPPTVESAAPLPHLAARPATTQPMPYPVSSSTARAHRIRLVPHLDSNRSLHFEPILRDVKEGDAALRIGRFTDRSGLSVAALNAQNTNKLAFKSKVVSRAHAEVWCDPGGKFFIKDTKSSSGTFLNHIRLSAPNTESRPFPLKDGDVLQLGVDYQGGTEEIYKCVKMRIELGREWQSQANAFNTNAMKQLKALSAQPSGKAPTKGGIAKSGLSDCCICLFCVSVHQSLFIAPCSHVFHYKCIRPMLQQHHPGFSCPLCRTFANLEEDVEVDNDLEVEGSVDTSEDNAGSGSGEGQIDTGASALAPARPDMPMELDAMLSPAGVAAGAETEVERDFMPSYRRVSAGTTLRNHPPSNSNLPPRRLSPLGYDGDASGYDGMLAETDAEAEAEAAYHAHLILEEQEERENLGEEQDTDHPLPPLPVPNSGMYTTAPTTTRGQQMPMLVPAQGPGRGQQGPGQGYGIMRPMSVPVHAMQGNNVGMSLNEMSIVRPMVVEDYSDNEVDGEGFEMIAAEGSGSSGEGLPGGGPIGTGGKRKR